MIPQIPYQPQRPIGTAQRTCGAAALAMVYESFGVAVADHTIWQQSAKHQHAGEICLRTHQLSADALARGFTAACLQVQSLGLPVIARLIQTGWRVIVNHLQTAETPQGHFSVVTGIDEHAITLHDPWAGPNRQLKHSDFMRLWSPPARPGRLNYNLEIPGSVLVAIHNHPPAEGDVQPCPLCRGAFALPQSLGIGWISDWADAWAACFCPHCDARVEPEAAEELCEPIFGAQPVFDAQGVLL